jgi:hypothetical protein
MRIIFKKAFPRNTFENNTIIMVLRAVHLYIDSILHQYLFSKRACIRHKMWPYFCILGLFWYSTCSCVSVRQCSWFFMYEWNVHVVEKACIRWSRYAVLNLLQISYSSRQCLHYVYFVTARGCSTTCIEATEFWCREFLVLFVPKML